METMKRHEAQGAVVVGLPPIALAVGERSAGATHRRLEAAEETSALLRR